MQATEATETSPRKTRARAAPVETPKSKKDQLVDLLRAKGGASVQQLSEALGWLPHTVRAALTGLRKANIAVEKMAGRDGEPTRYRINAKRSRSAQ
jgi:predicted ArsR family transcriptional regulator